MTAGRSRRRAVAALVLPLVVAGLVAASPASAADDPGKWYLDAFHITEIQASGLTGEGVTIAVLDSPINIDALPLAGANVEVREPSSCLDDAGNPLPATSTGTSGYADALHGTAVASVIAGTGAANPGQAGVQGVAPGARILYYAVAFGDSDTELFCEGASSDDSDAEASVAAAIDDAVSSGADLISISLGVAETEDLAAAIAHAHREGVVVLAALPNSGLTNSSDWPSAANGVVAVQSIDSTGSPQLDSSGLPSSFGWPTVAGPGVDILTPGQVGGDWSGQSLSTGTSFATPIVAGFLALVKQKYPDATGNQLIQTLIRNTGVGEHELVHDDQLGYGIASATSMLAIDPAQYDDVNPLLFDGDNPPSIADSTGQGEPTGEPTTAPEPGADFPLVPVLAGAGVGLLVLIGIIVLIVILATRRSRTSTGPG